MDVTKATKSLCLRAPKDRGEEFRRLLLQYDALNTSFKIKVREDSIYIPIKRNLSSDELSQLDLISGSNSFEIITKDFEAEKKPKKLRDTLGFSPSYEVIGDIAILSSDSPESTYDLQTIGEEILKAQKSIKVVIKPLTPVQGTFRLKNFEVIAGEKRTDTIHKEYGCMYSLDLQKVYFSPRLSMERVRVASQVKGDEVVVDMFSGVGPFTIQIAKRAKKVIAIDMNPDAIKYLQKNIKLNHLKNVEVIKGDARKIACDLEGVADRVIMNLPHSANEFLGDAKKMLKESGMIHYYDIRSEDDLFDGAIKMVLESIGDDAKVDIHNKRKIRSYAPYRYNIALDAWIVKNK